MNRQFSEVYGDKADLTDYLLIFTAANNDGIRAMREKRRKLTVTDEFDKFGNGFFGKRSNVEHLLDYNRLSAGTGLLLAAPPPLQNGGSVKASPTVLVSIEIVRFVEKRETDLAPARTSHLKS